MADVATIAKDNGFDTAFKEWLDSSSGISIKKSAFSGKWTIPDEDVDAAVQGFQDYLSVLKKQREMELMEEEKKRKAIASMLVSSGFNFEGYSIVKYSGYISGDDVVQVDRSKGIFFQSAVNVGNALTDALTTIRRNALLELKEAAYALGCNAVIGVDFDYITLEPETASNGVTTYLPYVFCVTANGNAVVIEKNDE